jgi:hypothetical protein
MPNAMVLLLSVALACTPSNPPQEAAPDTLRALYEGGQSFAEFMGSVKARRESWESNYVHGGIDPALLARARAVPGRWRLLVVSLDSCSDSANTIPYIASLVDSLAGKAELRMVTPSAGRRVMEGRRTWDSRAATPTVVLLDEHWKEMGCWVERPASLGAWARQQQPRLAQAEFVRQKIAWYERDQGRETLREIVEMMERAGPDRPCGGNTR